MSTSPLLSEKSNIFFLLSLVGLLLLGAALADAQQINQLTFVLKEAETETNITNVTLQIKEKNLATNKELTITEYLTANVMEIYLPDGVYELIFIADEAETDGKDYYIKKTITSSATKKETIFLFPVASVQGIVVDRLDNLLKDAEIKLVCDKEIDASEPAFTDKYGTFALPTVPTGNCIITASFNEYFDRQQLAFNQGDAERIQLKLEEKAPTDSSEFALLFFGIVITMAIIGGVIYWFHSRQEEEHVFHTPHQIHLPYPHILRKKRRRQQKVMASQQAPPTQQKLLSRVQHILPTLREREQLVIQFLLGNNHKATQAKIRHATKIPKTSLIRILHALQAKKIIAMESTETTKTIKLTEWFLEK